MIDIGPLLNRVAHGWGVEHSYELANLAHGLYGDAEYCATRIVRREDLAAIVTSALFVVMCADAAMAAERASGPESGRAQAFRLLSDLAAVDAVECARSWAAEQHSDTEEQSGSERHTDES